MDEAKIKKIEKYLPFAGDEKGFAMLQELESLGEKMEEKMEREDERHTEMMECMKEMAEKEMPEMPAPQEIDLSKVEQTLSEIKTEISKPKEKPVINIQPPEVNVEAPIVNIPETKFPDKMKVEVENFPEKEDLSWAKDLVRNGRLKVEVDKVGGGGGGSTNFAIEEKITDQLATYFLTDIDDTTATEYYGYVDKNGAWYIKKVTTTAIRFCRGSSGYTTSWTGRAGLSYDYFNSIF